MSYDTWLYQQAEKDAKKRYPDNAEEIDYLKDISDSIGCAMDVLIEVRDSLNKNKHYPDVYINIVTAVDCCCNALDNLEEYYK